MSRERILILDEEANTQWTLKELLEGEDFSVIPLHSINQALESYRENDFGGLITEYRINQSTTLDVIREFKKAFPEAFVMMLSHGEVQEGEYEEFINAGVDDFFYKPIAFKKLLLHLEKGLSHRRDLLLKNELQEDLKKLNSKASNREEGTTSNRHPIP
jgi:DNA-binding NtrC family response regulator